MTEVGLVTVLLIAAFLITGALFSIMFHIYINVTNNGR